VDKTCDEVNISVCFNGELGNSNICKCDVCDQYSHVSKICMLTQKHTCPLYGCPRHKAVVK